MSVRTYDPKEAEIFQPGRCSAGCGKEYYSICRFCNLAYCFEHLKTKPHACDTKEEYWVPTFEEWLGGLGLVCDPLPENWDPRPKGCFAKHPQTGEICQLPQNDHVLHKRAHPNGVELECWIDRNGASV